MVQASTICMASLMFCMGLVIGLVFHLPGASNPHHDTLDQLLIRSRRELLQVENNVTNDDLAEVSIDEVPSRMISDADFKSSPFDSHKVDYILHPPRSHTYNVNTVGPQRDISLSIVSKNNRRDSKNVSRTVNVLVANNEETSHDAKISNTYIHEQRHNNVSIVRGIYWSPESETLAPEGFTDVQLQQWRGTLSTSQVVGLKPGCGRQQNRQVILDDGSMGCARYRVNIDQIQGEIYSFYLSRVLGIYQVPPSVLAKPDALNDQWRRVQKGISTAQWSSEKVLIVTPWVNNLEPEYIPEELRTTSRKLHPEDVRTKDQEEIRRLIQWSDLIVFDYLTANLDRVVNNMYNEKWNPNMMENPAHNLEKDPTSGLLVFLDNESGLFHSYRLLEKYNHYHSSLLKSLCVFRKQTVDKIRGFVDRGNIGEVIMDIFRREETLNAYVPKLPQKTLTILNERLRDVYNQISSCEALYS